MHYTILQSRYAIKALQVEGRRPIELSDTMKPHPLSYMELPFDPEYSLYNGRMTPERLNNVTDDEQYWAVRQKVIFRNTGEFPIAISGPDAAAFADHIFARDLSCVEVGRCSYNFPLYHDGTIITDGVILRLADNKFWMVQADGELIKWYKAHLGDLDVTISDPGVWVTQIQGPQSMNVLRDVIDGEFPKPWRYFDIAEVAIAGEPVIITRTGFSNELGWEFYLRPENCAEKIGEAIWQAGRAYGMILTATPVFRARRIEAGLLSQADFVGCTPYKAGLGHFLHMDKTEFIGHKALKIADTRSHTFGLRVRNGIAERGRAIILGSEMVGEVLSSSWSPYLVCGVAFARMDDPDLGPGTDVSVRCIDGSIRTAQICYLPMYDKAREIVHGRSRVVPSGPEPWKY